MGDGDVLYMRDEKSDEESGGNDDSIWDDTALIEAYDHAVSLAKSEVETRLNGYPDGQNASSGEGSSVNAKKKSQTNKYSNGPGPKRVWSVGDPCRCIYSADNVLYEADIVKIEENCTAVVRYFGYNNEEEVMLSDVLPSRGQHSRRLQEIAANPESTPQATAVPSPKHRQRKASPSGHRSHNMDWEPQMHNPWPSSSRGMDMPPPQMMGMPQMMFPPPPPLNMLAAPDCPGDESEAMSAMLMSWYMSGFHTGYYQGIKQANTQTGQTPTKRK